MSYAFSFYNWNLESFKPSLEKTMAPHSSTLAWKIPWTEEPGGLQSMGSLRVRDSERLHFPFSLSCIGEGNGNPLQCSCLENPRDGEPCGLPSMGSHRVGHDWSDLAAAAAEWGRGMSGKEILGEVLVGLAIEFAVYGVCQRFIKLCMYYSPSKSWLNIQRPWPGSHGC